MSPVDRGLEVVNPLGSEDDLVPTSSVETPHRSQVLARVVVHVVAVLADELGSYCLRVHWILAEPIGSPTCDQRGHIPRLFNNGVPQATCGRCHSHLAL